MKEGAEGITLAAQFEYCGCIASNMSRGLTHDEIMLYAAGKETSVINNKMDNFVKKSSKKCSNNFKCVLWNKSRHC